MKLFKNKTFQVEISGNKKTKSLKSEPIKNKTIPLLVLGKLDVLKSWFLKRSLPVKIIIICIILGFSWFTFSRVNGGRAQQVQYQTAMAEQGTLIVSVSASGTILSGNSADIATNVTGKVKEVYVANGDKVTKGQKIAEIVLDEYALERQSSAWVSYLDAVEAVKTAEKNKIAADIRMWEARQAILNAEEDIEYKDNNVINPVTKKEYTLTEITVIDKTLEQVLKAFDVAELSYKNADADISNAQVKAAAAWRNYQEFSSIITAPESGTVTNFALAPGLIIANSSGSGLNSNSGTGSSSATSQSIGKIENGDDLLQATVNLTEIDVINIEPNQKVTLTLDVYPGKTFTGKVLAVNTSGGTSSGVTSYPVTILLDPTTVKIYSNMAVNAQIVTNIRNDVILVPVSAVQTSNGQSIVQVMENGQIRQVVVETGLASDTQTEIVSGLSETDVVVTNIINQISGTVSSQSQSPFGGFGGTTNIRSGFGGNSSFGSGGVRIIR